MSARILVWLGIFPLLVMATDSPQPETAEVDRFVHWLLDDGARLEDVRFAEVVEAVSGKAVLPIDPADPVDRGLLAHLEATLERMLKDLAEPGHALHQVGRVNEISRHVEDYLQAHLNEDDLFECTVPLNALGASQRAGYPDLLFRHIPSGRMIYLDPKVYKAGSEQSSFRTFYFEPKRATNKILEDASHLIIGIAHSGRVEGRWQLERWKIVDLIDFRVRLKAEFQASNRELYQEASVLAESE
jgi:hypothetical protein